MPSKFQAAWQALFGRAEPPKPVAAAPQVEYFKPTFETVEAYGPGYGLTGYQRRWMNSDYFATQETAEWIMRRFGAREVFERVAVGNEGPLYTCSQKERWIRFEDGTEANAGVLAALFVRNPEERYPGLAEKFAWNALNFQRQMKITGGPMAA